MRFAVIADRRADRVLTCPPEAEVALEIGLLALRPRGRARASKPAREERDRSGSQIYARSHARIARSSTPPASSSPSPTVTTGIRRAYRSESVGAFEVP